ncbi:FtsW/RodA/SpoVE family cell cycle protein [Enterococcus eurekensis]|uniref:FtsW/RodA/SpoVE family cell cycle protein n=2 Tax=Enterococcus TaxID=1350 RepID=A0ABV9M8M3_9ENTE
MNKNIFRNDNRIDYGVILPVFLLCLIGIASLYVAYDQAPMFTGSPLREAFKQAIWCGVGMIAVAIIMQVNVKWLWKLTPFLYLSGLVVMGLLTQFYDRATFALTGSRNWFRFGSFSFQPAELMKIAVILMLAYVVTKHNSRHRKNKSLKTDGILIAKMLAVILPVIILIMIQDDFGTMLVFIAILGGVFLMSGISWKIIIPTISVVLLIGAGTIFLVLSDTGREFLYSIGFSNYQFARIDSWIDPFHDVQGNSAQVANALMAIGSGGMTGKGFNVSDIYIPVRESDMIFTVPAENFGFVGGSFIILLYFVLIYRMLRVCFDTNNEFYAYIATGIIMMILFHVFENIGANIGLLPLTGIPLPFISQGGSALLSNMMGVGLILSMRYQMEKGAEV